MDLQMGAAFLGELQARCKFFSEMNIKLSNIIGDMFSNLVDFSHLLGVLQEKNGPIKNF